MGINWCVRYNARMERIRFRKHTIELTGRSHRVQYVGQVGENDQLYLVEDNGGTTEVIVSTKEHKDTNGPSWATIHTNQENSDWATADDKKRSDASLPRGTRRHQ